MDIQYKYFKNSRVDSNTSSSNMSFSPDASREPTFLVGEIDKVQSVLFREAISALHDVVVSDFRYQVDNADYKVWRAEQDALELQQFFEEELSVRKITPAEGTESVDIPRLMELAQALPELQKTAREKRAAIRDAYPPVHYRVQEWELMFHAWQTMNPALASFFTPFIYDPVITVHPDKLFFECFSQDESSYGRLTCDLSIFSSIDKKGTGTTNVDYSQSLFDEFQKIRSYKNTNFAIDPTGFEVQTNDAEDSYIEKKIDLPDSWVRGFLQVSAAMQIPAHRIRLHPLDLHKICLFLRKNKELHGPRSIRFELTPGEAPVAMFEPWGTQITCGQSTHTAHEETEVRLWGRRRLHQLERLIPLCNHFDLCVKGAGLPYFIVADMGAMQFTLGLSSWTANNFSNSARFDLLAPRHNLSETDKMRVYKAMQDKYELSPSSLAELLGIDLQTAISGLNLLVQSGRAMFDLSTETYQLRELFPASIDLSQLQFSSEEEQIAIALLQRGLIGEVISVGSSIEIHQRKEAPEIHNVVEYMTTFGQLQTTMTMNDDQEILGSHSSCTCKQDYQERISGAPCEHILALRLHLTRPVPATLTPGTTLGLVGTFDASMVDMRKQMTDMQLTLVDDALSADVILQGDGQTTQSLQSFQGSVLTIQQWNALVQTCTVEV